MPKNLSPTDVDDRLLRIRILELAVPAAHSGKDVMDVAQQMFDWVKNQTPPAKME